jgi:hypothetical protein
MRVILLLVGLWIGVPAWASASPHNRADLHLLGPGIAAVADLDGDHIPDIASGINLGRTAQGYAYRVDLDLTDNLQAKPFSVFSSEPNGVDIEAIDVDGDHDLDLVITSRVLRQPIGIWINDGAGNFAQGDAGRYAFAFNHQDSSLRSSPPSLRFDVCREPRHASFAASREIIAIQLETSVSRLFDSEPFCDSRTFPKSARFRAPPTALGLC